MVDEIMEVVDLTEIMFDLVGTPGVDGLSVEQVCKAIGLGYALFVCKVLSRHCPLFLKSLSVTLFTSAAHSA